MGTSGSALELSGKLRAAGTGIERATLEGVREAAFAGKEILNAAIAGAVGPERRMSNVGRAKGGARIGAFYTAPKSTANPTALLAFRGPVALADQPQSAHTIAPKGSRSDGRSKTGRRRRGAKGMVFPDGGVRNQPVRHPGTPGKDFVEPGFDRVKAVAPEIVRRAERRALAKVFGL